MNLPHWKSALTQLVSQHLPLKALDTYNEHMNELDGIVHEERDEAHSAGYEDGFHVGKESGYDDGYSYGYDEGLSEAGSYEDGYDEGYSDGLAACDC